MPIIAIRQVNLVIFKNLTKLIRIEIKRNRHLRAAYHSDHSVLKEPFSPILHKKIPEMRQHSGNFVICLEEKFSLQNCLAPRKGGDLSQARQKAQKYFVYFQHF